MFDRIDTFGIGFDRILSQLQTVQNNFSKTVPTYPPYNIRKVDDSNYVIEVAVAGFGKSDINIEVEGDTLRIAGGLKSDDNSSYLYKGIANRAFERVFTLADKVEVKNAELVNGMLRIWLDYIIEENKKLRKINIMDTSTSEPAPSKKELLQETVDSL